MAVAHQDFGFSGTNCGKWPGLGLEFAVKVHFCQIKNRWNNSEVKMSYFLSCSMMSKRAFLVF
jgi:hypothetical protein